MKSSEQKDRIYFEALVKLNAYIEENYEREGFLPSENKLSELLGVSRSTCRTVLATFARNGFIISYPKRGHFVLPKCYRIKKIGIVVRAGEESPFIPSGRMMGALINHLESHRIFCQIIQSTIPDKIKWRAMAHGVQALVWLQPDPGLLSIIFEEDKSFPFPQLVISNGNNAPIVQQCTGGHYVLRDLQDERLQRIRFFLERGHRKIAWMGKNPEEAWRRTFPENETDLEEHENFFVDMSAGWEEQLTSLVKRREITALNTSGSPWTHESIFKILNDLPRDCQPEILLPSDTLLSHLQYEYPKINMVGHSVFDAQQLGLAGAEEVVGYMNGNKTMESRIVKAYEIKLIAKA